MSAGALVIGAGSDLRRDDGAGLAVARRVRAAGIDVFEARGDLSSLVDSWAGKQRVIIVDAVRSGAVPGTLHRFDAAAAPIPALFARASTHAFGVAEAVELARALGRLPRSLVVYGIEGSDFSIGEGLTPEVALAVADTAALIVAEARSMR